MDELDARVLAAVEAHGDWLTYLCLMRAVPDVDGLGLSGALWRLAGAGAVAVRPGPATGVYFYRRADPPP